MEENFWEKLIKERDEKKQKEIHEEKERRIKYKSMKSTFCEQFTDFIDENMMKIYSDGSETFIKGEIPKKFCEEGLCYENIMKVDPIECMNSIRDHLVDRYEINKLNMTSIALDGKVRDGKVRDGKANYEIIRDKYSFLSVPYDLFSQETAYYWMQLDIDKRNVHIFYCNPWFQQLQHKFL